MYGLGIVGQKIGVFTQKIVEITQRLKKVNEYSLADQLFRSGTSIGANCSEATFAVSKADFANKLGIALKEANETNHWIDVVYMTKLINEDYCKELKTDIVEICKLLTTIRKNTCLNIENEKKK